MPRAITFALTAALLAGEGGRGLEPLSSGSPGLSEADAARALAENPAQAGPYVVLGARANSAKKLDLARGYLLRALALEPQLAEARHQLALNHGQRREWAEAAAQMARALEAEPRNPVYRYNLGALYYNSGRYPAALAEFRRAAELDPARFEPGLAVAAALEASKQLPEARAAFSALIRRRPADARGYQGRAGVLLDLGRASEARRDALRALSLKPGSAATHYLLGRIFEHSGKPAQAVEAYEMALQLEPGHLNAHYRLSLLYARLGRAAGAARAAESYRSLRKGVEAANALLFGMDFLKAGDLANAAAQFTRALESDPRNTQALYYSAVVAQRRKQNEQALAAYRAVLALDPALAAAHANLGLLLAASGAPEARAHLERAVELDPPEFAAWYTAAYGFSLLEDYAAAQKAVARALDLWPGHPGALKLQRDVASVVGLRP